MAISNVETYEDLLRNVVQGDTPLRKERGAQLLSDDFLNELGNYATHHDRLADKGEVSGSRVELKDLNQDPVKDLLKDIEELKDDLSSYDGTEAGKNRLTRNLGSKERELAKRARPIYRGVESIEKDVERASRELKDGASKLKTKLREEARKEADEVSRWIDTQNWTEVAAATPVEYNGVSFANKDAARKYKQQITENANTAAGEIESYVEKHINNHEKILSEARWLRDEVKTITKLNPEDVLRNNSLTKAVENELKPLENAAQAAEHTGGKLIPGAALIGGAGLTYLGATDENGAMNIKTGLGVASMAYGLLGLLKKASSAVAHVR